MVEIEINILNVIRETKLEKNNNLQANMTEVLKKRRVEDKCFPDQATFWWYNIHGLPNSTDRET